MRRIYLLIYFLVCYAYSFAQGEIPVQTLGNNTNMVIARGIIGADTAYLFRSSFEDTISANVGLISLYPGMVIRTGDLLWIRNSTATQWVRIGSSDSWNLNGNTVNDSNFLGTLNDYSLKFRVNNTYAGRITPFDGTFQSDTSQVSSVYIGLLAGASDTGRSTNVAIGAYALHKNQPETYGANVAIGWRSGSNLIRGIDSEGNTMVGHGSAQYAQYMIRSTAIGVGALRLPYISNQNIAIGAFPMELGYRMTQNVGIGNGALRTLSLGWFNVGIGAASLGRSGGSVRRIVVTNGGSGYTAATVAISARPCPPSGDGSFCDGVNATATATVNAGSVTAVTVTNMGAGYNPDNITITINGDGIGATAVAVVDSASNNTAVGSSAGYGNRIGKNNTYLGYEAGYGNGGNEQGWLDSNMTHIGAESSRQISIPATTQLFNSTTIGWNSKVRTNNTLVLGDSALTTTIIGTTAAPNNTRFHIVQNNATLNTTAQPMTISAQANRWIITRALQEPGSIPDNFAPLTVISRLKGAGTINFANETNRFAPIGGLIIGGFTNTTAATFNSNPSPNSATSVLNVEWQTDRTASQTVTGWVSGIRSSFQRGTGSQNLLIENYADFVGGTTHSLSTRGIITNRYGVYMNAIKIDSILHAWAFYNAGTNDSNYFAGPTRFPNLSLSDTTLAKPVGVLSNGLVVRLPYWAGSGGGSSLLFARTDARNETENPMYFSAAEQEFSIDSVSNFFVTSYDGSNASYLALQSDQIFLQRASSGRSNQLTLTDSTSSIESFDGAEGIRIMTSVDSAYLIYSGIPSNISNDTSLYKLQARNTVSGALVDTYWPVGGSINIYNTDGTLTGNRTLNGAGANFLYFTDMASFRVYDVTGTNRLFQTEGTGASLVGTFGSSTDSRGFRFTQDSVYIDGITQSTDTTNYKVLVRRTATGALAWANYLGGGGSGVTTMTAFGSSPNANGATISGSNLTIQPADGSNPGGIALGAQTMGTGDKTFTDMILGAAGSASSPSFSFSGDPNTGVYSFAADVIGFTTGGSVRMFINASGMGANNASGPIVSTAAASATVPTLIPNRANSGTGVGSSGTNIISFVTNGTTKATIGVAGAWLSIIAGTTAAAPLQLTSGTNLTTAAAGAIEYNGSNFFFTATSSNRRQAVLSNVATPSNGFLPIGNGTDFTLASLTGTTNQVSVTNGSGSITLALPQNIHTAATPQFGGLGIGTSLTSGKGVEVRGTYTNSALDVGGAYTLGVNADGNFTQLGGGFTEAASGTHALLTGVAVAAPLVTPGAAAVTNTATLFVGGPMGATVTGTNYALWVDDGVSRFDGGIQIGTTSTTLLAEYSSSSTLDFASTPISSSTDMTLTVTGAAIGDVVSIGVPNGSVVANSVFTAWVSAADTVTIRFSNLDIINPADPPSGTFRATVKHY